MDDITVFYNVVFTFYVYFAGFATGKLCLVMLVVCQLDDIGLDIAALEVTVNYTSCLGRFGAYFDGPGSDFLRTSGKVCDELEEFVRGLNESIEASCLEAVLL